MIEHTSLPSAAVEVSSRSGRFERRLCRRPNFRKGSVRVNHAPALNDGTAICSGPSRLDGCPALYTGRSIKSR